ncbi:hypothetical protein BDF21DRAFT_427255 [Thamnidium elegans]|nr:hypothetical protein BDF21DRAFT_427255 [Thamnidium elegans]
MRTLSIRGYFANKGGKVDHIYFCKKNLSSSFHLHVTDHTRLDFTPLLFLLQLTLNPYSASRVHSETLRIKTYLQACSPHPPPALLSPPLSSFFLMTLFFSFFIFEHIFISKILP